MLYRVLATLGGMAAGIVVVVVFVLVSSLMHPMPEGMDMNDPEQMNEFVSGLPVSAFLMMSLAWVVGAFVGAYVARRLAPSQKMLPAVFVISFFTAMVISNLITIPHPIWLAIFGVASSIVFGLIGMFMAGPREYVVSTVREISAPVSKVFKTIATIEEFKKAVPGIVKVEFLTESRYGVGTRFKETRMMNGKEAATELEVVELVENESIRMVSDAGGAIWDTTFRVSGDERNTKMEMKMDARPHAFAAKIVTPMILSMVAGFVEKDMDSVKEFCEAPAPK